MPSFCGCQPNNLQIFYVYFLRCKDLKSLWKYKSLPRDSWNFINSSQIPSAVVPETICEETHLTPRRVSEKHTLAPEYLNQEVGTQDSLQADDRI